MQDLAMQSTSMNERLQYGPPSAQLRVRVSAILGCIRSDQTQDPAFTFHVVDVICPGIYRQVFFANNVLRSALITEYDYLDQPSF